MTTHALLIPPSKRLDKSSQTPAQVQQMQQGMFAQFSPGIERGLSWLNSLFGTRTIGGILIEDLFQILYTEQALFITPAHLQPIVRDRKVVSPVSHAEIDHIAAIEQIKHLTGLPQYRIAELFGVSRQSLAAWMRREPIADTKYRRVLAVYDVVQRASQRYPKPNQLRAWLDTPLISEEHTPAQLLAIGEIDRARLLAGLSSSVQLAKPIVHDPAEVADRFRPLSRTTTIPSATDDDESLAAMYGDPFEASDE